MADKFTYLLRVRYSECDAQKVVFNAKYAEYVDIAATEFTRAIWGDYNDLLAQGFDNQVVNLTINWNAPARFDDVIEITVASAKIGNSSYTLHLKFTNHQDRTAIACADITYVMVNADKFEATLIPDHLKASLQHGAPEVSINHAGT